MKKTGKRIIGLVILLVTVMSTGIAFARMHSGQTDISVLKEGEVLESTGFFAGNSVVIDGRVEGTTFATGNEVRVNGTINGDLFVSGQYIYIDGEVKGNIYGAGRNVTVRGKNERELFVAGQYLSIESGAEVGRDLYAAGENVSINGSIGRNTDMAVEELDIQDGAEIGGNLLYRSSEDADIGSGAQIVGETKWEYIDADKYRMSSSAMIWKEVIAIVSALLIYLIVEFWRPGFWDKSVDKIMKKPAKTFGIGILSIIIIPILSVLFMFTIVGIPLGIISLIGYGLAIYISNIVVAVCIARFMEKKLKWPRVHKGIWTVLLGLIVISVLTIPRIPILSFLTGLVVISLGLGSLILTNYRTSKANSIDE